ncbi:type II secretion system F family protein [Cutibacterium equinum]|uniref:Type II secretion system F family protein n=2 Tax=Cutibacterium equinum TaxID=3016342 RepID=A0ABY7R108_9ACTN|nr:type II secretion system F family protein [Cutibacterium equinum]WCC80964.1 type II secretion system F family protein [Cutibacterium equinum]
MLSSAMEAGLPLRSAVTTVAESLDGPCGRDLRRLESSLTAGVADSKAWAGLATVPVWRDAAQDVSRAVDSGEGISELLLAHAAQMQIAAAEQAEKKARKAGVDAIGPLVCCHLPAFLLVGVVPIIAGMVLGAL